MRRSCICSWGRRRGGGKEEEEDLKNPGHVVVKYGLAK